MKKVTRVLALASTLVAAGVIGVVSTQSASASTGDGSYSTFVNGQRVGTLSITGADADFEGIHGVVGGDTDPITFTNGAVWKPKSGTWATCGSGQCDVSAYTGTEFAGDNSLVQDAANTRPQDGTNCEPAFVVQDFAGVTGSLGYISAGHCDTKGKVALGLGEDHDYEIVPLDVNRLLAPTTAGGQELRSANWFRSDLLDGDSFASADRSNMAHITSIGGAAVNDQICKFGGKTAHECGRVVRDDYHPTYVVGSRDFLLADFPCVPGDSGAAVVSGDGTRAIGIISGRRIRDSACIISRMDRIFPGQMKLYDPPALDAKYRAVFLLDGKWQQIGQPTVSRATCVALAEKTVEKGIDFRCLAV